MKRAIAGVSLAVALVAGALASRPLPARPDAAQVQAWLHDAADRHDAAAEAALADASERGDIDARRAYTALLAHRTDASSRERLDHLLADAATAGDGVAATQLAERLSNAGAGAAPDDTRIAGLLAQGAAGQVAAASRLLALRAADPARAAALMGQAADGGDVPAMFLHANQLRAGHGMPRDDARALALYRRAADADYAPAIQALALAWRYGELGLQADASQARLMDHEAAEALAHAAQ